MRKVIRACAAGLAGMWILIGVAQEAAEEDAAEADVRQEQEVALGGASSVAAEAAQEGAGATPATAAVAGEPAAAAGETADALPEIAPLDELFVPSLGLQADEPWDDMPVDF